MTEGIIIALIGLLGGAVGVILNNLFNFSNIKEKLSEKHTLTKAEEYHNLTMKDILETRKDIEKSGYILNRVNDTAVGISTDVKLLSKDFQNYKSNIEMVNMNEKSLIDAVKTIENYIQRLGEAERINLELRKEVQSLKIELEEKNKIINELENQLSEEALKQDDDFSL